jgi:hypothetical protein
MPEIWKCISVELQISMGKEGRWDCLVGTATRYGLDGPGIESRWDQDFPRPSTRGLFSRESSGRGVALTTHLYLAPGLE